MIALNPDGTFPITSTGKPMIVTEDDFECRCCHTGKFLSVDWEGIFTLSASPNDSLPADWGSIGSTISITFAWTGGGTACGGDPDVDGGHAWAQISACLWCASEITVRVHGTLPKEWQSYTGPAPLTVWGHSVRVARAEHGDCGSAAVDESFTVSTEKYSVISGVDLIFYSAAFLSGFPAGSVTVDFTITGVSALSTGTPIVSTDSSLGEPITAASLSGGTRALSGGTRALSGGTRALSQSDMERVLGTPEFAVTFAFSPLAAELIVAPVPANCSSCAKRRKLAALFSKFSAVVYTLPPDELGKLKEFLGTSKLLVRDGAKLVTL